MCYLKYQKSFPQQINNATDWVQLVMPWLPVVDLKSS